MARRRWSIARRLFALQLLFVVVGAAVGGVWSWQSARHDLEATAAEKSTAVAVSVARNPFVVDQVSGADPSKALEPYAVDLMHRTHTDFITIMAPDRTRFTHPDPAEVGRPFVGTTAPALAGRTFTETSSGTLGPSVRAVTPITGDDGRVIGLVAAGVTVENISEALVPRLLGVVGFAAAVIAVSALFSWLLSRYLDRVTAGRGPEELARVFASYSGVLHSVHEGLVVVDRSGAVVLHNDRAAELLHLPPPTDHQEPVPVESLDVPEGLRALLRSGDRAVDETHATADRVLVVNQELTFSRGTSKPIGTVTTIRDQTELLHLSGELAATRTLTDALRSQTHEFANRMHAVVALMELGRVDEAIRFASDELERTAEGRDQATDPMTRPDPTDPTSASRTVIVAVLRGKQAQAHERGVELTVDTSRLADAVPADPRDVITILGNLVDNAVDAVTEARPAPTTAGAPATGHALDHRPVVRVTAETTDGVTRLVVADNGAGILDVDSAYRRGWSTKESGPDGRGFGLDLVQSAVARSGAALDVETGPDGSTFTVDLPGGRLPA